MSQNTVWKWLEFFSLLLFFFSKKEIQQRKQKYPPKNLNVETERNSLKRTEMVSYITDYCKD